MECEEKSFEEKASIGAFWMVFAGFLNLKEILAIRWSWLITSMRNYNSPFLNVVQRHRWMWQLPDCSLSPNDKGVS